MLPRLMRAAALLSTVGPLHASDPFAAERERMVREQIENRGIRNRNVVRVLRATPRQEFVPKPYWSDAYADYPVAIGYGATISQPYIVALMTDLLGTTRTQRVLEIGTGSGYQAALLAQLVRQVYTIEIVPELAETARATLRRLGYSNVVVRQGDGYLGWPECAPFDRVLLTAAPPDVPQALIDQLAPGGRLVAPIGSGWFQNLIVLDKGADGTIRRSRGTGVMFVPMRPGAPAPSTPQKQK